MEIYKFLTDNNNYYSMTQKSEYMYTCVGHSPFDKLNFLLEYLKKNQNYYTLYQNTEFLLNDKRVLILNEMHLSICWSTILRYCKPPGFNS